MTAKPVREIEYLINSKELGIIKIKVPSNWRITWGKSVPSDRGGYNMDSMCMRIYEGQQQRAVFNSVTYFRDLSIELFTDGGEEWVPAPDGEEIKAHVNLKAIKGDDKYDEKFMVAR